MSNIVLKTEKDLKLVLATQYMKQIENFFGDNKTALKFLSSVMADVQKTPALMECVPASLINSYMTMAQLGLMPSGVSGEAYVLPYRNKGVMTAQFQLGYKGLVTLFYRAGGQRIRSEIIRANDIFSYENGEIHHKVDIFKSNEERGEPIGAYAIATVGDQEIAKAMNHTDILAMGVKYSKSYGTSFSPWDPKNDPELWMWKKTVLKQLAKLIPQNETIAKALAEDNEDSRISDIRKQAEGKNDLSMGNFLKPHEEDNGNQETNHKEAEVQVGDEAVGDTNSKEDKR